jgi:iron-sulfur cluster repair protein YtfE (RIC family)
MTNPPLDRHPSLQPFSRDHHVGLVHAAHLLQSAEPAATPDQRRAALSELLAGWDQQMRAHFDEEEQLLPPLMTQADTRRLNEEHTAIRALISTARKLVEPFADDPDPNWVRRLGQLYHDHIRWEERQLFPAIEAAAGSAQLATLGQKTAAIEAKRTRA